MFILSSSSIFCICIMKSECFTSLLWTLFVPSAVTSSGYQPRPMIVTSAGSLPSRNIIHVVGHNDPAKIKDMVHAVLKVCEENKFSSVSFPALGTGLTLVTVCLFII